MQPSGLPQLPGPPPPVQKTRLERVFDDTHQYDVYKLTTLRFAPSVEIINRRKQGGSWEPFLMVAPSAVLSANGLVGDGLYSLLQYSSDSEARIGRYSGMVIARFAEPEGRCAQEEMARFAQEGRRHMLLMRVDDGQDAALVDGSGVFLPKISMANDARGMHRPDIPSTCLRNNARFGRDGKGYLFKMRGRAIPAANVAASSLSELWRSEILVSYSSFYWNLQERVGSEELPLDLTRAESDESE